MLYKRIFPNSKGGSIESEKKIAFSYLLVNLDYADSHNNFLVPIFKCLMIVCQRNIRKKSHSSLHTMLLSAEE